MALCATDSINLDAVFNSPSGLYSIRYPSASWMVEESDQQSLFLREISSREDDLATGIDITITPFPYTEEIKDLPGFVSFMVPILPDIMEDQGMRNVKVTADASFIVDGIKLYRFEIRGTFEEVIAVHQYVGVIDDMLFILSMASTEKNFPRHAAVFEAVRDRISFPKR